MTEDDKEFISDLIKRTMTINAQTLEIVIGAIALRANAAQLANDLERHIKGAMAAGTHPLAIQNATFVLQALRSQSANQKLDSDRDQGNTH